MTEIVQSQKDIAEAAEQSLQPRARERVHAGVTGLLNYLSAGTYRVAPWWSPQRDADLDAFWKDEDHLAGAIGMLQAKVTTVPVRVMPRDTRLKKNIADAERFNAILNEEAGFGNGWISELSKWLADFWGCDNGAYWEIIGPGDPLGPIEGEPTGLAHLDSHRVQRTGNVDFPVIYTRPDGSRVKIHRTRVSLSSDMPSAREEMFGVGFCALSRTIHNAQTLIDVATYKAEKMGSRPKRGILTAKGISTDAVLDSLAIADEQMDSRNLSIYSQLAVLGDIPADASLDLLDLISLPDGFDEETSTRLAMFAMALAFGVPIRWIWPASVSGATKADAMYQHIAGLGGGIARVLSTLTFQLGGDPNSATHSVGKFLPPHLKLVFDFQDDEQDSMRADVRSKRSNTWKVDLEDGLLDVRTAREQALEAGDLSQSQFDRLELSDGRLPDGAPVLSLFHAHNEPFLSWLDLLADNPLATSENDAMRMLAEIETQAINVQDVIANSSNATTKAKADQALAALGALKALYAPLAQQQVQSEIMARFGAQPSVPTPPTEPNAEEQPQGEAQKDYDYSVGAGEIIGGELARSATGQFISAAEMKEQLRAAMMARMQGANPGTARNSAADKRLANRAKVAEQLGLDTEAINAMISGDATFEQQQALAEMGLATLGPDGLTFLNPNGRKLLSAANSGDVDAAKEALAKAKLDKNKPGKGKGGAVKPSPEDKQRQREEAQRKLKEQNRATVAEALTGRIDQAAFSSLLSFVDGQEIDPAQADALAQQGLLEIDPDGNPRLTQAGRGLANAADKGDVRPAKDALSRGADQVRTLLQRAERAESEADSYDENSDLAAFRADKQATQYEEVAEQLRGQIDGAVEPYGTQAASLDARATNYDQRAVTMEQQATDYETQADQLAATVSSLPTQQQRAQAQQRVEELRQQAQRTREQAQEERGRATDYRKQGLDLRSEGRTVRAELEKRVQEYLDAARATREQGAQAADEWRERADKMRQQILEWRASVGNASLNKGLAKKLKEFFVKQRNPAIPTPEDVEVAVRLWDADPEIPERYKGILDAKKVKAE